MNGMKPFSEGPGGGMREGGVYFFSYLGIFPSFQRRSLSFLPSFLSWFLSLCLYLLCFSVFLWNLPLPSTKAPISVELLRGEGEGKGLSQKSEGRQGDDKRKKDSLGLRDFCVVVSTCLDGYLLWGLALRLQWMLLRETGHARDGVLRIQPS